MKILSLTAQKPFDTGSGVYLTELIKGFKKKGHENSCVCGIYEEDKDRFSGIANIYPVVFNAEKIDFPISGMSDEMPYLSKRYRDVTPKEREKVLLAFTRAIKKSVEIEKPDVIISHHLYELSALATNLVKDIPVYGVCHGSDLRQIQQNPNYRDKIIEGIRRLSGVFCLHEKQKEEIIKIYGIDKEKIFVIGAGYNKEIFKNNNLKKNKNIIFAGKISKKKGVLSLVKAMKYVDKGKLLLCGGAGNKKELEEIKKASLEYKDRIVFLGKLSQAELAEKFNETKVFVLPSFFEGLPLVALEALACNCNVVMTNLPGIQRWYNDFIPSNDILFIDPPKMKDVDNPDEKELLGFEKQLGVELNMSLDREKQEVETIKASWDGVCDRILEKITYR